MEGRNSSMNEKIIFMVTIALVLLVLLLYLIHQFLQIGKYEEELKSNLKENLKEIPKTQKEFKFLIIFGNDDEQHIHYCLNDREILGHLRYYSKNSDLKDYMVFFIPDFIQLSSNEYQNYYKKNYEK